jgi:hypothetical protein
MWLLCEKISAPNSSSCGWKNSVPEKKKFKANRLTKVDNLQEDIVKTMNFTMLGNFR